MNVCKFECPMQLCPETTRNQPNNGPRGTSWNSIGIAE